MVRVVLKVPILAFFVIVLTTSKKIRSLQRVVLGLLRVVFCILSNFRENPVFSMSRFN